MRCYNGAIPESDYRARYGITQAERDRLIKRNPEIHVTYFPREGVYIACLRGIYWEVSRPRRTFVDALLEGIRNKNNPFTNLMPLRAV